MISDTEREALWMMRPYVSMPREMCISEIGKRISSGVNNEVWTAALKLAREYFEERKADDSGNVLPASLPESIRTEPSASSGPTASSEPSSSVPDIFVGFPGTDVTACFDDDTMTAEDRLKARRMYAAVRKEEDPHAVIEYNERKADSDSRRAFWLYVKTLAYNDFCRKEVKQ